MEEEFRKIRELVNESIQMLGDAKKDVEDRLLMIRMLESDKQALIKMNTDLAWELHDKDVLIERLSNQRNTMKEMLENEGYFDGTLLH